MKRELQDKLFDSMLEVALDAWSEQGECPLKTEEEMQAEGNTIQFTPKMEKKLNQLVRKQYQKERRIKNRKRNRCLAACFAVMLIAGYFTVTQVDAIRIPLENLVIDVHEKCTDISFKDEASTIEVSEKFVPYLPAYVPDGFVIQSVRENGPMLHIEYDNLNHSDQYYILNITLGSMEGGIDTEDAIVETLKMNHHDVIVTTKGLHRQAATQIDSIHYYISGDLDRDDLLQILQNIPQ